jgi:dTMP kinase
VETDARASASRGTGRFVTIEGPDGSGKTTLAGRLVAHLTGMGIPTVLTREPGGTVLGERIRVIVLEVGEDRHQLDAATDALLFSAARARHVEEVILPALGRGEAVVSARYADSTLAYQGYGAGLPLETLRAIQDMATGGLVPDLTILLDLPVSEGLARKAAEITRFEESFDEAYHERVRAGFLEMAAAERERWVVVDARAGEEEVLAAAVRACARLPALAGHEAGEPERAIERMSG